MNQQGPTEHAYDHIAQLLACVSKAVKHGCECTALLRICPPIPILSLRWLERHEWPKKCTDVGKSRSCRNCLIIFLLSWPAIWTCVHGAIWIQKLPFTRFTILCMHACQILRSDVASFSKRGELLQTASKLLTITGRSTYIGPIYIKSVTDNNTIIMSTIIRISLPANSSSSSLQDKLA